MSAYTGGDLHKALPRQFGSSCSVALTYYGLNYLQRDSHEATPSTQESEVKTNTSS